MDDRFLKAVRLLRQLSRRHRLMAAYAAEAWSDEYLNDQILGCSPHTTPLSMVLDEPPPEIAATAVDPSDRSLN